MDVRKVLHKTEFLALWKNTNGFYVGHKTSLFLLKQFCKHVTCQDTHKLILESAPMLSQSFLARNLKRPSGCD
jgi:hypothetical protein